MMNKTFYQCVRFLEVWADRLNMTYEELNVWIFCIIEPVIFLILVYIILKQRKKIKQLKSRS